MTNAKTPTQKEMMAQLQEQMNQMGNFMMQQAQMNQQLMTQFAQPAAQPQFGGVNITAQQAAEIAAHEAKIAEEVERIHGAIRQEVKDLGRVDEAHTMLDSLGLDYEGKASFASNAMYNARRSCYSIRAGVERQEEYMDRARRAPVANPALAQSMSAQTQQQEIDIKSRLDKADTQKYVYFTFEAVLVDCLNHLQAVVDQNERQGMASMDSDSDTQYVSQATLDFLCNTPVLSEPDYVSWREEQEKSRETRRRTEVQAIRHNIRATTALHSRAAN